MQRANAILNEVRRARDEVEQLQGGTQGSVVAGLSMAAHMALLPPVLRPFRNRYQAVRLHVIEGLYPTLEGRLKDGSVDFYVGPEPERPVGHDLQQDLLFTNTRTILCRRDHPLARVRSLAGLAGAEWATTSITSRAEEELDEVFSRHGLPPPVLALQSQSALTLIVSIAYSDLLAMVPVQWMEFAPTADVLQTIPVREALPAPAIVLIRRAGLPLTPAATYLTDLMRKAVPAAPINKAR